MGGERGADTPGIEMGASADLLSGADRPRSSTGWFGKQLAAAGTNRSRFRRSMRPVLAQVGASLNPNKRILSNMLQAIGIANGIRAFARHACVVHHWLGRSPIHGLLTIFDVSLQST